MIRVLLAFGLLVMAVERGFPQGQVNFNNTPTTFGNDGIDRFVYYDFFGGTRLSGTNFVAALYWSKTGWPGNDYALRTLTDTTLQSAVGHFRIPTSPNIGTWSGGARFFAGANIGETVNLQVRIWDITRFATHAEAVAGGGLTTQSDVFSYLIPASTDTAGLAMKNLRSFLWPVNPEIPEPSTIALGIVGLGSLLLFRRKKAYGLAKTIHKAARKSGFFCFVRLGGKRG